MDKGSPLLFSFRPERRREMRFLRGRLIGLTYIAEGLAALVGYWPGWTMRVIMWWDFGHRGYGKPGQKAKA